MGYEKLNDLSTDTVFKLGGTDPKTGKPSPTRIEGYYLGNRAVQTSTGNAVIHVFQTSKGNEGIWGTKKLNDNLTRNIVGLMTLVVYKGKKKLTGGKTQHEYDMSVDKENRIEVSQALTQESGFETDDAEADLESSDGSGEVEYDSGAAALAESRKQEVEGLLRRNNRKN